MSTEPYKRKQGEFELRVLKDGRVVMIAPDKTLLEIAEAIREDGSPGETVSGEQNAKRASAERQQATDPRRDEASDG